MKKIVCLLLIILFNTNVYALVKDTDLPNYVDYNINFGENITENIVINLEKDAYTKMKNNTEDMIFEEYVIYDDFYPIYSNMQEKYTKSIIKSLNVVKVKLSYVGNDETFIKSNFIVNCFEKRDLLINDDVISINLSGEFYCINDNTVNIYASSDYKVTSTNAKYVDGYYTWTINEDNYKDVSINYEIEKMQSSNISYYIISIAIVGIIVGIYFIIKKIKKAL